MATLQLLCRRCGREVPSNAADHSALCVICIVADAIASLKADYERNWAKRARYLRAGVSTIPVERQLTKLARKLGDQVHARIVNPQLAIPIINAHLQEARDNVERPSKRIHLPRPGDFARRLARA
jgi:hypothetical protein